MLEIPTGPPDLGRQLWRRPGGSGTFCWFFSNFMFIIWDSRHEDLQLFFWVSKAAASNEPLSNVGPQWLKTGSISKPLILQARVGLVHNCQRQSHTTRRTNKHLIMHVILRCHAKFSATHACNITYSIPYIIYYLHQHKHTGDKTLQVLRPENSGELRQKHNCWGPGSLCHQVISNHGTDYIG